MMQLEQIFSDALGIELEQVSDALSYQGIPQWDSVAHMGLIAQLEDHYGVLLDTDDIIDMSSVAKAREILTKYGVAL
ncbi:acyl carrier protein [Aeromonas caviae]|jgi:acyl carrier protein|nr:acyl carrier protein [Aeromonas enteropelogenes]BBG88915.1 acyl carrier protein [Aeromonas caviae]MCZ0750712.1 acyl carrier protein [Aeromonas enteropelogenes]UCA10267.1 acyl carrier protein [Aeromonas enteropelogenes]BBT52589.1 acyl carrier protein [Aeromonas caviae]BDN87688.1 acyl carrier protein [Aeromonas caviae]